MNSSFAKILETGGKTNSLGRVDEVIEAVILDHSRLNELYSCMFEEDPWVRMRAADAFEKVCRPHPEWISPYIDRIQEELSSSMQPSIQWHLAQIYAQVEMSAQQRKLAVDWLEALISTVEVDWIVAANTMKTLEQYAHQEYFSKDRLRDLLKIQQGHHSKSVVKRATKTLNGLD